MTGGPAGWDAVRMEETGARERTLVLMRHAKAENAAASDHARELTPQGRAAAAEAGRWLATQVPVPDHVLASDAVRTLATWREVSLAAGWDVEPEASSAMYAAGPESALDLIREVPADVATLVVVGHNPTVAYLAELLDDGNGDDDAITRLVSMGYPPGATTLFSVNGEWARLAESSATVVAFHVGQS